MPSRATGIAFALPPRPRGGSALRWLYGGLRAAILDGRLARGACLPSTRALAGQSSLARGTVVAVYEQLAAEGYIESRRGSGSYVRATVPDRWLTIPSAARVVPASPPSPRRALTRLAARSRTFPDTARRPVRAFRTNQPALDLFPTTLWAQVSGRRLRRATVDDLRVGEVMGYGPLRAAVADYLTTTRGVVCGPDQVLVVSGVQEALDLTARVLLEPRDRVYLEDPGYTGAALALAAAGARVMPLRVDAEGAVPPGRRAAAGRLAYLTPAHQFPLGITMSLRRRLAWLEWANATDAVIVEDDYDSEYRYAGAPVPALQGLDRHGHVLFAGSFSKVLFPSLRLGYLVVPQDLVDPFLAVKSLASRSAPVLGQAVVTDFLVDGHFGRHVRRMRAVYAERRAALVESAATVLAETLEFSAVEAGLQTTAWLRGTLNGVAVAEAAAKRGVEVMPLARYARAAVTRDGLVMGFAAVEPAEIRRGVRDLARALRDA